MEMSLWVALQLNIIEQCGKHTCWSCDLILKFYEFFYLCSPTLIGYTYMIHSLLISTCDTQI